MKTIHHGVLLIGLALSLSLNADSEVKIPQTFSETELISLMHNAVEASGVLSGEEALALTDMYRKVATKLSDYHVTGWSHCTDFNIGAILDTQNPLFQVHFKDGQGNLKKRNYRAHIETLGLKAETALRFNMICFTDVDFNYFDGDKTIEIGKGFDIAIPGLPLTLLYSDALKRFFYWTGLLSEGPPAVVVTPQERIHAGLRLSPVILNLNITYASFKNAPGGFFMFSIPLGVSGGFGIVKGGTLSPVV